MDTESSSDSDDSLNDIIKQIKANLQKQKELKEEQEEQEEQEELLQTNISEDNLSFQSDSNISPSNIQDRINNISSENTDYSGLVMDGQFTLCNWSYTKRYKKIIYDNKYKIEDHTLLSELDQMLHKCMQDKNYFKQLINSEVLLTSSYYFLLPLPILKFVFQLMYKSKDTSTSMQCYQLLTSLYPIYSKSLSNDSLYIYTWYPSEEDLREAFIYFGYPKDDIILENSKNLRLNKHIVMDPIDKEYPISSIIPRYYVLSKSVDLFPAIQLSNLAKYISYLYTFFSYSSSHQHIHNIMNNDIMNEYKDPYLYLTLDQPFQSNMTPDSSIFPKDSYAYSQYIYLSSLPQTLPYTTSFTINLAKRLLLISLDPRITTAQIDLIEGYKCIVNKLYESNIPFKELVQSIVHKRSIPDLQVCSALLEIHPTETPIYTYLRNDIAYEVFNRVNQQGIIF